MKSSGKIIPIAFPDQFVKLSDEKRLSYLHWFGLGTKTHIKAGHASLVLVDHANGELHYYDFGRYITPKGKGRVRSKRTDIEVKIPFTAQFDAEKTIVNLDEILIWLQSKPEITHGYGRLVASVADIDFVKAYTYVETLQEMGSIPYKAFGAGTKEFGSNCSRLVTDTIIEGISNPKVKRKLKLNKQFTPSPIGNVQSAASSSKIYCVEHGIVSEFNSTAFKENIVNFFDKKHVLNTSGVKVIKPKDSCFLKGTGSSAYFKLKASEVSNEYLITRYNEDGQKDFEGRFKPTTSGFSITKPYKFVYDSNCLYCHIEQEGKRFKFNLI